MCVCVVIYERERKYIYEWLYIFWVDKYKEPALGVMVINVGNGHGDQSSNPGQGCLHFT